MFEAGSLWKPPPLKKVRPPVEPATAESGQRRGQLTSRSGGRGITCCRQWILPHAVISTVVPRVHGHGHSNFNAKCLGVAVYMTNKIHLA